MEKRGKISMMVRQNIDVGQVEGLGWLPADLVCSGRGRTGQRGRGGRGKCTQRDNKLTSFQRRQERRHSA